MGHSRQDEDGVLVDERRSLALFATGDVKLIGLEYKKNHRILVLGFEKESDVVTEFRWDGKRVRSRFHTGD